MKSLLFAMMLFPLGLLAQIEEQKTIYFADSYEDFPSCKVYYLTDGRYDFPEQELIELDLPNTISVVPASLTWNGLLNFHSYSLEAEKYGTIEVDAYDHIPMSIQEVLGLIEATEDSIHANWLVLDDFYLWQKYNVVRDAKPSPITTKKDTTKIDYLSSGIIDGVWIEDTRYIQIRPGGGAQLPEDYFERSKKVRENSIQPKLDSLLRPFYFSNHEVTNNEYRQFINWVSDSVELIMAYSELDNANALWLVNCSKKQLKKLDPSRKKENRLQYGLSNKNKKNIEDSLWFRATENMYYPRPERFYTRRMKDAEKLSYRYPNGTRVRVYPDTSGFLKVQEIGPQGGFLTSLSWHPAFGKHPVVNLNADQIMAFTHWKQGQLNERLKSKGIKVTVRPPTINEYEFAVKSMLGEPHGYYYAIDQSNERFSTFKRKHLGAEFIFYQNVDFSLDEKRSPSPTHTPTLNFRQWYGANQLDSPVRFLNGNVSEFVIDQVTKEKLKHYKMNPLNAETTANFVLGSNYIEDVKTIGDDQYNSIFYKTLLKQGESSPLVGFRLVYFVERIE